MNGVTSITRFVTFKTTRDPIGELTWRAVCVSGEEEECGASCPEQEDDEDANEWMAKHASQTGHSRFKRFHSDYAIVEPDW